MQDSCQLNLHLRVGTCQSSRWAYKANKTRQGIVQILNRVWASKAVPLIPNTRLQLLWLWLLIRPFQVNTLIMTVTDNRECDPHTSVWHIFYPQRIATSSLVVLARIRRCGRGKVATSACLVRWGVGWGGG